MFNMAHANPCSTHGLDPRGQDQVDPFPHDHERYVALGSLQPFDSHGCLGGSGIHQRPQQKPGDIYERQVRPPT
jgi:hypothetical protein